MTEAVACALVAVPIPVRHAFSYEIPSDLEGKVVVGGRVRVPFGPRSLAGFVVSIEKSDAGRQLKPIRDVVDSNALLTPELIELGRRVAERYCCGIGEALGAFVPAGVKAGAKGRGTVMLAAAEAAETSPLLASAARRDARQKSALAFLLAAAKAVPKTEVIAQTGASPATLMLLVKKGLLTASTEYTGEDVFAHLDVRPSTAPVLNAEQEAAAREVGAAIQARRSATFLIQGVTGSGKTEVYLDAIRRTLDAGRSAIVLVPEISLTPQTVERFQSRFGTVAVLHSHLSDAERARQWDELQSGRRRIAIGPRSAVFAPAANLGLIVVDEEHETTFKQQNVPRYVTRDVARMRAGIEGAVVVLGTATPSLEIDHEARVGAVRRLILEHRVADRPLPPVSVVDMRAQKPLGPSGLFAPILSNLIHRALDRGEQCLLFLNRRGYSTSILCPHCGFVLECKDCAIPMVFYRKSRRLLCHYCNAGAAPPSMCPKCRRLDIRFSGFGTETVEFAARALFPAARIARMDRQSMQGKDAHADLLDRVRRRDVDILVGTQMIAKGFDFPYITLIGVISADTTLLVPDFRAAERTFQLLTQVAGRAGRGTRPGHVIVQTYMPDHYALSFAARHDFEGFAAAERIHREAMNYPPFGALARIVVQAKSETSAEEKVSAVAAALRAAAGKGARVLGPAPAPLALLKGMHRHHVVICGETGEHVRVMLAAAAAVLKSTAGLQVLVDVDPTSMM